jgi:multidrug efflux pump subunit AcrA (membrane-fusion protein)
MMRRLLASTLVLSLASCGFLPGSGAEQATQQEAAAVAAVRGPFRVTVRAEGELEAPNASPIAVPPVPTGALKIKEVVAEGAMVEKGDVIIVFDDTQLNIDLKNHTATFRSAERKIDKTRIDWSIESGSIGVMKTVAELERGYASEFALSDAIIYSKREILESELDKEYAEEKIVFADGKLLLRGEYFNIDERILDVEKDQAQGKVERVETSLGKLVLEAPIGGMIVYKKSWNGSTVSVGDTLWPGNVVLSIVDPSETVLEVDILEKDANGIQVGAETEIRIDAHAARPFKGKVSEVSKLSRPIERGSPVKYFQAKIAFDEGDPVLLKPGMKGEARITVANLDDAVIVPRSAVHGTDGDYRVVLDGLAGPETRLVELGPGDVVRVSITSGLEGGESVLLGATPADSASGTETAAAEELSGEAQVARSGL